MSAVGGDDGLLIMTAVAAESRAVLAAVRRARRIAMPGFRAWTAEVGGRPLRIVQSGIGPARARAALQAVATRHPLVMSVGFAGGLAPASRPGDVVLPTTVVWEEATGIVSYTVPAAIRGAVHARIPPRFATRVLRGPLLSSPTIVASTEEKRAAGLRCNAVAVEMEAAALIALASERGADVMPLRVILDTADVSLAGLPPNLDSSWRARAQLMARPATWARVLSLARTIPHAASVLSQTLAAVLPGI